MTADLPVQDLIAEALFHEQAVCFDHVATSERPTWCCVCGEHDLRVSWYVHTAAAVVAAIRGTTVERQRDLTGGVVERAWFDSGGDYYRHAVDAEDEEHLRRHGCTIRPRLVGPWREDPA